MKPILILQHQENDGPAYLETWLNQRVIPWVVYRSDLGPIPETIHPYSALAIMGGAISANDQTLNNLQTQILILQAIHHNIPVLGHCLGGQLLAKALGAKIGESPQPEIGWQPIQWLEGSQEWFGSSPTEQVMHWHYEAFELPIGAIPLAASPACPHQAFSYGIHMGMQFHIEVHREKVDIWTDEVEPGWEMAQGRWDTVHSKDRIMSDTEQYLLPHHRTADQVYDRWLSWTSWKDSV